jgi:hypothetical protein
MDLGVRKGCVEGGGMDIDTRGGGGVVRYAGPKN